MFSTLLATLQRITRVKFDAILRFFEIFTGYSVYAAMKAAIEVLARFIVVELVARKIRVNAIAPGAVATNFNGGGVRDNETVNAYVAQGIALGRVGARRYRWRGCSYPIQ